MGRREPGGSRRDHVGTPRRRPLCMRVSDPQTDVAPGRTRGRNVRSKNQCSMCPAIHTKSRSWLRSSSTREPSDPLLRVVFRVFFRIRDLSLGQLRSSFFSSHVSPPPGGGGGSEDVGRESPASSARAGRTESSELRGVSCSPPGRADRRLVRLFEPGAPWGAPPVAA